MATSIDKITEFLDANEWKYRRKGKDAKVSSLCLLLGTEPYRLGFSNSGTARDKTTGHQDNDSPCADRTTLSKLNGSLRAVAGKKVITSAGNSKWVLDLDPRDLEFDAKLLRQAMQRPSEWPALVHYLQERKLTPSPPATRSII